MFVAPPKYLSSLLVTSLSFWTREPFKALEFFQLLREHKVSKKGLSREQAGAKQAGEGTEGSAADRVV